MNAKPFYFHKTKNKLIRILECLKNNFNNSSFENLMKSWKDSFKNYDTHAY